MNGVIFLYTGPMFAGKSEKLLRELKKAIEFATKKGLLFKPAIDTRSNIGCMTTHDGNSFEAITIQTASEILTYAQEQGAQVVSIDEAQFLDSNLPEVCFQLASQGTMVHVSALSSDYQCVPFAHIAKLACSPYVQTSIMRAICSIEGCDNLADWSEKIVGDTGRIQIGGIGDYRPVCTLHHPVWQNLMTSGRTDRFSLKP